MAFCIINKETNRTFEKCLAIGEDARVYRNLAAAYYSHRGDKKTALNYMKKAVELSSADEKQITFEAAYLMAKMNVPAAEIEAMIARLQGGVGAAVKTMHSSHALADETVNQSAQVRQALENILAAVGVIVGQSQQISTAAEEQTAVAHDIDRNIVSINEAGQRTAEGAGHTAQASRELTELVAQLQRLIGAFRV